LPNAKTVFVVDDDPSVLRALQRVLRSHGYDIRLFQSAEAFESHGDFEQAICIILDVNLGGSSGIDLKHRLNDAGISVPVIYITASVQPGIHEAAVKSGCFAFLKKPFPMEALIDVIKEASAQVR
jgi:FixJ family two-component response regulator